MYWGLYRVFDFTQIALPGEIFRVCFHLRPLRSHADGWVACLHPRLDPGMGLQLISEPVCVYTLIHIRLRR